MEQQNKQLSDIKTDLIYYQKGRAIRCVLLFIIMLVVLDFAVGWVGDTLSKTKAWPQTQNMGKKYGELKSAEYYVLGSCRATFFKQDILEPILGASVETRINLAEGFGALVFDLALLSAKLKNKKIIVALDDGNLYLKKEKARKDLMRRLSGWNALGPKQKTLLQDFFSISYWDSMLVKSQIWKYRGSGWAMFSSSFNIAASFFSDKQTRNELDQDSPVYDRQIAKVTSFEDKIELFKKQTLHVWSTPDHAIALVSKLIGELKANQNEIILMIPPVHRLNNTPAINQVIYSLVKNIADTHGLPIINYMTENNWWYNNGEHWFDPIHLVPAAMDKLGTQAAHDILKIVEGSK